MLPGVDVSQWQGTPGSWRPLAGAIDWAAIKLTELQPDGSRYVNPLAGADWASLREAGKGRVAYLFAHPATSATETVAFFLTALESLGYDDADGVALDLEVTDGRNPALVSTWAKVVLRSLRSALRRNPLLYTYLSFALEGNCSGLGTFPLWMADPSSPPGKPRIPPPWTSFAVHQWRTDGIDRDVAAYPSLAAMQAALGRSRPQPGPLPHPDHPTAHPGDPMLLNRGADAITPLALPDGARHVRLLVGDGSAVVRAEFPGMAAQAISLSWASGAHEIPVPDSRHGVRLTRVDGGSNDVSAVVST